MKKGKKYTVNVAYTTPSGRMHIGHGLGHTIADIALRYGSIKNEKDTFFGFGIHSTGKDLIKILNKLSEKKELPETLKKYNISQEKRDEILSHDNLSDQVNSLVQEYKNQYQNVLEKMGIKMDYDSFFSTNQEANQKYTQWTLKKLDEKGLIIETESERPYCPKCDDIKHIDNDLSEVSAIGNVKWDEFRIEDGKIHGGEFECRLHNGQKIEVQKRKERAINYGDPKFQQKTINLAKEMNVFPKKHKNDLEGILKTRLAKPFERNANENIGATSPFDQTKKVEALSDSNIYMEFYGISQLINRGDLNTENLTDEFFDYIYLNKGDSEEVSRKSGINKEKLDQVKNHIEEIYPVDLSISGFEHFGVHVPFSLFTHSAVLPEKYFFPEYLITSHVTKDGEKMSKSKGNVVYLDDLMELTKKEGKINGLSEEASLDAVRFFLSYYQSLGRDFDWNDENFKKVGIRGMRRYTNNIMNAGERLGEIEKSVLEQNDKWISTVDQNTIGSITNSMDEKDFRNSLISLIDFRSKALSSYLSSDKVDSGILSRFLSNQIDMGYPFMPRVTKELKNMYFPNSVMSWPKTDNSLKFQEDYESYEHSLKGKSYEKNLLGDINSKLGKMFGRKEISEGESVTVSLPTEYHLKVVSGKKLPFSEKLNIGFSVNPRSENIEIIKEK